ncbi:hypothetical protein CVD28_03185 [Bacillus sp. M6-12]|uniref:hypothetical protein n=1 Tax=Bacillus sp. M6-12 TaxID=2054166 RepID=UPI000C76616C|nr:hypothetical protein [Bacillus sp. M6-12]PLS19434.1 hypothetical protein CVD28_03185 [Bacillus sp. M6-12]
MERKTIQEWETHFDTFIMDGDGFPQGTVKNETLFTEEEFVKNTRISTVKMSEKLIKAWEQNSL